jgi:hypothetical protein
MKDHQNPTRDNRTRTKTTRQIMGQRRRGAGGLKVENKANSGGSEFMLSDLKERSYGEAVGFGGSRTKPIWRIGFVCHVGSSGLHVARPPSVAYLRLIPGGEGATRPTATNRRLVQNEANSSKTELRLTTASTTAYDEQLSKRRDENEANSHRIVYAGGKSSNWGIQLRREPA